MRHELHIERTDDLLTQPRTLDGRDMFRVACEIQASKTTPGPDAVNIARFISVATNDERTRRAAHSIMARNFIQAYGRRPLVAARDRAEYTYSELMVQTVFKRLGSPKLANSKPSVAVSDGFELGHVEQLGAWDQAVYLDDEIRDLPESAVLLSNGINLEIIDPQNSDPQIRYKIGQTAGDLLTCTRLRPVADLRRGQWLAHLVRRSSFLILPDELDEDDRRELDEAISLEPDEREGFAKNGLIQVFGRNIVEKVLAQDCRSRDSVRAVQPISSLYFMRLQRIAER